MIVCVYVVHEEMKHLFLIATSATSAAITFTECSITNHLGDILT